MKEPDYYDPWEDSGGSSYLCCCPYKKRKHKLWCPAANAPKPVKAKK